MAGSNLSIPQSKTQLVFGHQGHVHYFTVKETDRAPLEGVGGVDDSFSAEGLVLGILGFV